MQGELLYKNKKVIEDICYIIEKSVFRRIALIRSQIINVLYVDQNEVHLEVYDKCSNSIETHIILFDGRVPKHSYPSDKNAQIIDLRHEDTQCELIEWILDQPFIDIPDEFKTIVEDYYNKCLEQLDDAIDFRIRERVEFAEDIIQELRNLYYWGDEDAISLLAKKHSVEAQKIEILCMSYINDEEDEALFERYIKSMSELNVTNVVV